MSAATASWEIDDGTPAGAPEVFLMGASEIEADPGFFAEGTHSTSGDLGQSTQLIDWTDFMSNPLYAGINGGGFAVAVIDSGADLDHPFFGPDSNSDGTADRIVYQYDFVDNDTIAQDGNRHGTNVLGIIGSQDANLPGMAPGVDLIVLRVLNNSNQGSLASMTSALDWLVANADDYNVVAVNLSISLIVAGSGPTGFASATAGAFNSQFQSLVNQGVAVVSSAGNNYYRNQGQTPAVLYNVNEPAIDPYSWAIGAVHDSNLSTVLTVNSAQDSLASPDRIAAFSQRSTTEVDIFAPGVLVSSAGLNGLVSTINGTSQAAPHVSGVVALMQDLSSEIAGALIPVADLRTLMRDSAVTITDSTTTLDNVINTDANYLRLDVDGFAAEVVEYWQTGSAAANTLYGWRGDDTIDAYGGHDIVYGADAHDTLTGGTGDDRLYGGAGNDRLIGAADTDTLFGGAGTDAADYSAESTAVVVSLSGGAGTVSINGSANDRLNDIEAVWGGSFADTLTGDSNANTLHGNGASDILYGGSGLDRIEGGTSDDRLYGGDDADHLVGGSGTDTLYGGAGADVADYSAETASVVVTLSSGAATVSINGSANDRLNEIEALWGGSGNDSLTGDANDNSLLGASGNDTLYGAAGIDRLEGGSGDDRAYGGTGNDVVLAGAGNDLVDDGSGGTGIEWILGEDGQDTIYGGDDADVIFGDFDAASVSISGANDTAFGDAGADYLNGGLGNDMLYGGSGDDWIEAEAGADFIDAGSANDFVNGMLGDDVIYGGTGDDGLNGLEGHDTIFGGDGSDWIYSDDFFGTAIVGHDLIYGGAGNDVVIAGAGNDTVYGGGEIDYIEGQAGDDRVFGDAGNNWILLGSGNDFVQAEDGNDVLGGDTGTDTVFGGSGMDALWGGPGDDTLDGGATSGDSMYGGDGDDTYVFGDDSGWDAIMDWNDGDLIDIAEYAIAGFGSLTVTPVGGGVFHVSGPNGFNVNITLDPGETLTAGDFNF